MNPKLKETPSNTCRNTSWHRQSPERFFFFLFLWFYVASNWWVSWLNFKVFFFLFSCQEVLTRPSVLMWCLSQHILYFFPIFWTTFDELNYVRRVPRFLSALRSTNFHYVATAIGDNKKNRYGWRDVRSTSTTFDGGLLLDVLKTGKQVAS